MERVGTDRIAATLALLGLKHTVVSHDCAEIIGGLAEDIGFDVTHEEEERSITDVEPALLTQARA